jgi:H+/Cl- antiporter ClcA
VQRSLYRRRPRLGRVLVGTGAGIVLPSGQGDGRQRARRALADDVNGRFAVCFAVGLAIGVAFGVVTGNVAPWFSIGAAIGVVFGIVFGTPEAN